MSKIIDCCTYNGECELFEIRYNVLKSCVDEFIVVEFDKTFSGKPKESTFIHQNLPKVAYKFIRSDFCEKYRELAKSSPNTIGAEHWKTEFTMKESIKDCLTHLKDDDIVFVGDCDEIWNNKFIEYFKAVSQRGIKIPLQVYTYYLNNKSSEIFFGTLISQYKNIKDGILNHLRTNSSKPEIKDKSVLGWHFTSMHHQLAKKLEDGYTKEDYPAFEEITANLEDNIKNSRDFLGRGFTYRVDESDWPQYLLDNREKYKHLLK